MIQAGQWGMGPRFGFMILHGSMRDEGVFFLILDGREGGSCWTGEWGKGERDLLMMLDGRIGK